MRAVEELVRRKLEKRAPDELSPKSDPYELRAPQGCSLLFPTATQTEGNQSGQTLLSQNPTGVKLQRRLIVKHVRQARVSLIFCGLAPPRLASKASCRNNNKKMTKARLGLMPKISGSWSIQPLEPLFLSLIVTNC